MKYKSLLMYILLFGSSCTRHAPESNWQTIIIDKQLTVQLPAQPQEMDVPGIMAAADPARRQDAMVKSSQAYVLRDTNAVYAVIKIPLLKEPTLAPTFAARKGYYIGRAIPLMLGKDYLNLLE